MSEQFWPDEAWPRPSITEQIREVLAAHPLIVGEGWYEGEIICDGCHLCLGDPAQHLTKFLAQALDPEYRAPESKPAPKRDDPRESQITWAVEGRAEQ